MTGSRRIARVWFLVAPLAVLFLAQQLGRHTWLFTDVLSDRVVTLFASLCKLACQLTGCVFAARCAGHFEKGSRVRTSWLLLSAWMGCNFLGQTILSVYENLFHRDPPIPSAGDVFFFLGYAFLIAAIFLFVASYLSSGFATGRIREFLLPGAIGAAVLAFIGQRLLLPIALAPTPLGERLVNVGYPLLDLALLVPALTLLRITARFRGGRVWPVWASLLAGIVFAAVGDVLLSDINPENLKNVGPLADLFFILSYLFDAYGAVLQLALLTD